MGDWGVVIGLGSGFLILGAEVGVVSAPVSILSSISTAPDQKVMMLMIAIWLENQGGIRLKEGCSLLVLDCDKKFE